MEQSNNKIWDLLVRILTGEVSPEEADEIDTYLKANPEDRYAFEMIREWWGKQKKDFNEEDAERSFANLRYKILSGQEPSGVEETDQFPLRKKRRRRRKPVLLVGAILLALVSAFLFIKSEFPFKRDKLESHQSILSQISTRYGSKSEITLSDGTSVWLNAGSELTYNNREFGNKNREVSLTGEAYFDVAKDSLHPFVIHTKKVNIKVLGTAFNVKAYPEDAAVKTTLLRGSIEASLVKHPKKKILLKPNQTLTVFNDQSLLIERNLKKKEDGSAKEQDTEFVITPAEVIPEDSAILETAWIQDRLAFRSKTFLELSKEMERKYDVKFNFRDSEIKAHRFTGIFKDETLNQALEALKLTGDFDYEMRNGEVYISGDPAKNK